MTSHYLGARIEPPIKIPAPQIASGTGNLGSGITLAASILPNIQNAPNVIVTLAIALIHFPFIEITRRQAYWWSAPILGTTR